MGRPGIHGAGGQAGRRGWNSQAAAEATVHRWNFFRKALYFGPFNWLDQAHQVLWTLLY